MDLWRERAGYFALGAALMAALTGAITWCGG